MVIWNAELPDGRVVSVIIEEGKIVAVGITTPALREFFLHKYRAQIPLTVQPLYARV